MKKVGGRETIFHPCQRGMTAASSVVAASVGDGVGGGVGGGVPAGCSKNPSLAQAVGFSSVVAVDFASVVAVGFSLVVAVGFSRCCVPLCCVPPL